MKKLVFVIGCYWLLLAGALFAQAEPSEYDVDIFTFIVNGIDRTDEIERGVYVLDNQAGIDELYLYGADDVLVEHIILGDYEFIDEDDDYEVLMFYDVWIQSFDEENLELESLVAQNEYDYYYESISWDIYNADTEESIMQIEFW